MAAVFTLLAWAANPFTAHAQLPDYLPTEGLVGWWPFNGNANDESGNGNDGVVTGATLTTDRFGSVNSAYNFNGTSDFISIPDNNSLDLTNQYTLTAWIRIPDYTVSPAQPNNMGNNDGTRTILGKPRTSGWATGYNLSTSPTGLSTQILSGAANMNCCANTGVLANQVPLLDTWYNLIATYDGLLLKIYVNSVLDNTTQGIYSLDNSSEPLYFGKEFTLVGNNWYRWFKGQIDDIAIYNRALTPEEVTALYTGQPVVAPCADPAACNFGQEGECVFAQPNLDCAGNCLNDCNNNGVCDENEVLGCTYAFACNYNPAATTDDGTCTVAQPNYDCAGNCLLDLNNNGLCDLEEVAGCTNSDAINYNAEATLDDGSCMVTCKGDFDNDGQITINDLLGFLASFGNQCAGAGCMDPAGCNYDPNATFDLDYCEYPAEFFNCEGSPINDADGDGVADELEVAGCTNNEACNFDPLATDDNGNCQFAAEFLNCDGSPINDADGDGVADELEVAGCTNNEACNFDPLATDDNGNCQFAAEFLNCDGSPINDADGDGIPDELEVAGCTDPEAGNYNPEATDDNGSCTFGLTGSTHTCGAENIHNPDLVYGSVTDIDGNTYRTIVIGEQEWMAENLNVSHYANGDPIPQLPGNQTWESVDTGAWCYYNNNASFECPYGKLYTWYVIIDARKVCPTNWHVPTDAEWQTVRSVLGGISSGNKMKSVGTQYWQSASGSVTNESGFSGLPGGRRSDNGFTGLETSGRWWGDSGDTEDWSTYRLSSSDNSLGNFVYDPTDPTCVSIRCIKD